MDHQLDAIRVSLRPRHAGTRDGGSHRVLRVSENACRGGTDGNAPSEHVGKDANRRLTLGDCTCDVGRIHMPQRRDVGPAQVWILLWMGMGNGTWELAAVPAAGSKVSDGGETCVDNSWSEPTSLVWEPEKSKLT